jgi:hypothetical protein
MADDGPAPTDFINWRRSLQARFKFTVSPVARHSCFEEDDAKRSLYLVRIPRERQNGDFTGCKLCGRTHWCRANAQGGGDDRCVVAQTETHYRCMFSARVVDDIQLVSDTASFDDWLEKRADVYEDIDADFHDDSLGIQASIIQDAESKLARAQFSLSVSEKRNTGQQKRQAKRIYSSTRRLSEFSRNEAEARAISGLPPTTTGDEIHRPQKRRRLHLADSSIISGYAVDDSTALGLSRRPFGTDRRKSALRALQQSQPTLRDRNYWHEVIFTGDASFEQLFGDLQAAREIFAMRAWTVGEAKKHEDVADLTESRSDSSSSSSGAMDELLKQVQVPVGRQPGTSSYRAHVSSRLASLEGSGANSHILHVPPLDRAYMTDLAQRLDALLKWVQSLAIPDLPAIPKRDRYLDLLGRWVRMRMVTCRKPVAELFEPVHVLGAYFLSLGLESLVVKNGIGDTYLLAKADPFACALHERRVLQLAYFRSELETLAARRPDIKTPQVLINCLVKLKSAPTPGTKRARDRQHAQAVRRRQRAASDRNTPKAKQARPMGVGDFFPTVDTTNKPQARMGIVKAAPIPFAPDRHATMLQIVDVANSLRKPFDDWPFAAGYFLRWFDASELQTWPLPMTKD